MKKEEQRGRGGKGGVERERKKETRGRKRDGETER